MGSKEERTGGRGDYEEGDNNPPIGLSKPCKHGSGAPARSKCSTGTQTDEFQGTPETGQLNTLGLQGTDVSRETATKWIRMIHAEGDTAEDPGDNGEGRQDRLDSSLESETGDRTEPATQMPI